MDVYASAAEKQEIRTMIGTDVYVSAAEKQEIRIMIGTDVNAIAAEKQEIKITIGTLAPINVGDAGHQNTLMVVPGVVVKTLKKLTMFTEDLKAIICTILNVKIVDILIRHRTNIRDTRGN